MIREILILHRINNTLPMERNKFCVMSLMLTVASCTGFREQKIEEAISKKLENIEVRERDIYADIGQSAEETKSGEEGPIIHLLELLDFENTSRRRYEDGDVFMVYPFKSNDESIYYSLTKEEPQDGEVIPSDSLLNVKNFVVEQHSYRGEAIYVVTILSSPKYFRIHDNMSSRDVLYLDDYTGYIIYAEINQKLCYIDRYENGEIFETIIDYDGALNGEYGYLCATKRVDTKSVVLDPAVCIADRNGNKLNWMLRPDIGDDNDNNDKTIIKEIGNEKTGGGYRTPDKRLKSYKVNVVSASPEKGSVIGGGEYAEGKIVRVIAREKETLPPEIPNIFKYWIGDFERYGENVRIEVTRNYESVAFFDKIDGDLERPCVDTLKGIGNIFSNMSIASSGVSGYRGGTYGMTRVNYDGSRKRHNGLDIAASIGTPIYCQCPGTVYLTRDCFDDDEIVAMDKAQGNRIIIESDGVLYYYCHLQGNGKAIGYNYRTKNKFKKGDKVYPGDIIGYSGTTGNAVGIANPHVHFEVHVNGKVVDPSDYINGTINVNNGRIESIKCDDIIKEFFDYEL